MWNISINFFNMASPSGIPSMPKCPRKGSGVTQYKSTFPYFSVLSHFSTLKRIHRRHPYNQLPGGSITIGPGFFLTHRVWLWYPWLSVEYLCNKRVLLIPGATSNFTFWPCSYDQMIVFVNTFICINFVFGWFHFHCIVEDKIYTSFGKYFSRGTAISVTSFCGVGTQIKDGIYRKSGLLSISVTSTFIFSFFLISICGSGSCKVSTNNQYFHCLIFAVKLRPPHLRMGNNLQKAMSEVKQWYDCHHLSPVYELHDSIEHPGFSKAQSGLFFGHPCISSRWAFVWFFINSKKCWMRL